MYILETDEPVDSWEEISSSKTLKHLQTQLLRTYKRVASFRHTIHQNREILIFLKKGKFLSLSHLQARRL
jgi:hypothetical protein